MTAYDDENIFAKILRGEMPATRVYEDGQTLAMMDIMPRADGHVLVLPKVPSRNILDIGATGVFSLAGIATAVVGAIILIFLFGFVFGRKA